MRTKAALFVVICAAALVSAGRAFAGGPIRIGINSQQYSPSRARVTAHIHSSMTRRTQVVAVTIRTRGAVSNQPPRFPPLSRNSPALRAQHPGGPGSFWFTDGSGHVCQYVPKSVTPCFTLVGPSASGGARGVSPLAVAESLARRIELAPGEIKASPTRKGLTGAESWFWLSPAPRRQVLSISLAGETVTVTANPIAEWRFGDGASLQGGPGVPYRAGSSPNAIRHVYQTRCLPGDQGHDPYVLASCGSDGYTVVALVVWRITYSASGPVAGSGALPTRTTGASRLYPVGESRAFLVSGGGQ